MWAKMRKLSHFGMYLVLLLSILSFCQADEENTSVNQKRQNTISARFRMTKIHALIHQARVGRQNKKTFANSRKVGIKLSKKAKTGKASPDNKYGYQSEAPVVAPILNVEPILTPEVSPMNATNVTEVPVPIGTGTALPVSLPLTSSGNATSIPTATPSAAVPAYYQRNFKNKKRPKAEKSMSKDKIMAPPLAVPYKAKEPVGMYPTGYGFQPSGGITQSPLVSGKSKASEEVNPKASGKAKNQKSAKYNYTWAPTITPSSITTNYTAMPPQALSNETAYPYYDVKAPKKKDAAKTAKVATQALSNETGYPYVKASKKKGAPKTAKVASAKNTGKKNIKTTKKGKTTKQKGKKFVTTSVKGTSVPTLSPSTSETVAPSTVLPTTETNANNTKAPIPFAAITPRPTTIVNETTNPNITSAPTNGTGSPNQVTSPTVGPGTTSAPSRMVNTSAVAPTQNASSTPPRGNTPSAVPAPESMQNITNITNSTNSTNSTNTTV